MSTLKVLPKYCHWLETTRWEKLKLFREIREEKSFFNATHSFLKFCETMRIGPLSKSTFKECVSKVITSSSPIHVQYFENKDILPILCKQRQSCQSDCCSLKVSIRLNWSILALCLKCWTLLMRGFCKKMKPISEVLFFSYEKRNLMKLPLFSRYWSNEGSHNSQSLIDDEGP